MKLKGEILRILAEKNGVSIRRIQQKISEIEKNQLVSRLEAACILAYESDIPIKSIRKHFDEETIKNVRTILQSGRREPKKVIKKEVIVKSKLLRIDLDKVFREIRDPLLPSRIFEEAKKMAECYPIFYVFENSIRNFILSIMKRKYGENWWRDKVSKKIQDKVEKRIKKEKENRWHHRRGTHPIFYTDFGDLKDIINGNWDTFRRYFPNQHWIISRLNDLELSRNIIAHSNPLPQKEIKRIKMYFEDWIKQIREIKEVDEG